MRQARHQYSLATHTARNTVPMHTVFVFEACAAVEVWICFLFAMSACPVTVAVGSTTTLHTMEDMALCALELHLVVECGQFLPCQLGDVGLA